MYLVKTEPLKTTLEKPAYLYLRIWYTGEHE